MRQGRPPAFLARFSTRLRSSTPWQIILGTLLCIHLLRNALLLLGLNPPEPMARVYSRNFYRASWIFTATDAGFWTAMNIRPIWARHFFSCLFSIYFLVFADQADEVSRKYRATLTVEQIRTSMERGRNPIIRFLNILERPSMGLVRKICLPRSNPHLAPITLYLFHPGPPSTLVHTVELVLNFPGGGFVSMSPDCHDDCLRQSAKLSGKTIVSVDYGKAPEYPFPWALEECFEAYTQIIASNGACLGMNMEGSEPLRVIFFGDSAGGNLASGVMLKIIEDPGKIRHPSGLVLVYPCLDFRISAWMSEESSTVLRTESSLELPGLLEAKDHMAHNSPLALIPDTVSRWRGRRSLSLSERVEGTARKWMDGENQAPRRDPGRVGTRLMMSSRTSYISDRILPSELMRSMAILYIGPNHRPDFEKNYLLSPIVAPDHLLAQFPPIYLLCGEKDPFVDDSVVFAGRMRAAKAKRSYSRPASSAQEGGELGGKGDEVHLQLIKGISHGFFTMLPILPEAKGALRITAGWMKALLHKGEGGAGESPGPGASDQQAHDDWIKTAVLPEHRLMERRRVAVTHPYSANMDPSTIVGLASHPNLDPAEKIINDGEVTLPSPGHVTTDGGVGDSGENGENGVLFEV
ncbi:Alpha/Beta hydrolase protein [Piptocephalis cylindrospora]|uniref:Alpha/Beta hydrolase protein n=1 Tax=Piptocephalis cylindrospora TaxID=1907219 RepID=A0A4V1IYG1_9FUNG|nr:Alpha/Beta hydrolase protein [Piptocephalis cylindrospora]|eukprot:RKP14439.1 Alpha/Beta hydrolase protein [Piptocephalis cylindrospora]